MLSILNEIEAATGREKIKILQQHPGLKDMLKYAYDPHMRFHLTAPDFIALNPHGCSLFLPDGELSAECKQLLDSLHTRQISGLRAEEAIADYISCLAPESADIFQRIINKDLGIGIGIKTINKAFPDLIPNIEGLTGVVITIPLCKTFDSKKISYPVLASAKYDGTRGRSKAGHLYSRSYKRIHGLEHIEKELQKYAFDFDGEIIVPGKNFDASSGLVRNKKPVPDAVYMVFDVDTPGTKQDRYDNLQYVFNNSEIIKLIPQYRCNNEQALMDQYHKSLGAGNEGIVICDPNDRYENRRMWWRLVPKKTADCKVIGFYKGKGKFANSLGGIIIDYKGHNVKVGSGFQELPWHELPSAKKKCMDGGMVIVHTDTVRDQIWNHQGKYLNKIAEIEFKEKTRIGSMRQPTFKRWRFDKTEPNFE